MSLYGDREPRLFDVDKEAPHVDTYPPGLLNEQEWGARSDVWHHGSHNPKWDRDRPSSTWPGNNPDPLMHVGTKAAAEERTSDHIYKFRVPESRVANIDPLGDASANVAHMAYNERAGAQVPESVRDSTESGGLGVPRSLLDELHHGNALPYVNSSEDSGSVSMVVPQDTARLWSEDVKQQQSFADTAADDAERGVAFFGSRQAPSPMLLNKAEFVGTAATESNVSPRGFSYQPSMDIGRGTHNPTSSRLMGAKPLASETRGGDKIIAPQYEGKHGYEIAKEKHAASQALEQDMQRLLG